MKSTKTRRKMEAKKREDEKLRSWEDRKSGALRANKRLPRCNSKSW
jgi:hypothetical protein